MGLLIPPRLVKSSPTKLSRFVKAWIILPFDGGDNSTLILQPPSAGLNGQLVMTREMFVERRMLYPITPEEFVEWQNYGWYLQPY